MNQLFWKMTAFKGICVLVTLVTCFNSVVTEFELNILHTNDVHARVKQTDVQGGVCTDRKKNVGQCFGGVARRYTVVKSIRATEKNVILLDAGDQFHGTKWYEHYKGVEAAVFMNLTKYDVMTLGNHEFDDGVEGVIRFVKGVSVRVVSCNIDARAEPEWPIPNIVTNSTIIERNGTKIGIIGYITPETKLISNPGPNIVFPDVISNVKKEALRLKQQGIKILIALGHAGFKTDKEVAEKIPDIDIVVGGHSNKFLYNGPQPSTESIEGPYPYVQGHTSSKTLVVQAFTFGKYLGHLKVIFDDAGKVQSYSGNPILLNNSYAEDHDILKRVKEMSSFENDSVVLGYTHVLLNAEKSACRTDCSMGNLISDALVKMSQQEPDDQQLSEVSLCIWNTGGIRASITKEKDEPITLEDLETVMPFGNDADIANMTGRTLREAIEHGVSDIKHKAGWILQVSGIRYKYNPDKPSGKRVKEIQVLCVSCPHRKYELLKDDKYYLVISSTYILGGNGGFTMLKNVTRHPGDRAITLVSSYIKKYSPLATASDGRILTIQDDPVQPPCSASIKWNMSVWMLPLLSGTSFIM